VPARQASASPLPPSRVTDYAPRPGAFAWADAGL